MTKSYFVSIECNDPDVTSLIFPEAKEYGIESIMGISESYDSDISSINALEKIAVLASKTEHDVDDKYNQKFFPHLNEVFCFGEYIDNRFLREIENEFAENNFMLRRMNILDKEFGKLLCQLAVCERTNENPLTALFKENDMHFSQKTVSVSFTLN